MTHEFDRAQVIHNDLGNWLCIHISNAPMARVECEKLKDGKVYTAKIAPKQERRDLDANAMYWALCGKLAKAMGEPPECIYRRHIKDIGNYELLCMHTHAVASFGQKWTSNHIGRFIETRASKINGCTTVLAYYGSSDFDKRQMSQLIDNCIQDCKNAGVETAAGVELSGAVYRLSDGAGVKTRAVGTGDCGGGLCAAGASRGAQCGLDAAAGVYGDVY